ncbi:MAG: DUF1735 domain-containing protein [Bacteroidales bacterium]|nr:DUF1735 domain-containing protein [Bacteroidales bacterium]MDD4669435.1 DUF1735 domain-containing protein [Bacteroidales bacterium]
MKKSLIIIITICSLCLSGCTKNVWLDNDAPQVYIPLHGFSSNNVWATGESVDGLLAVYCSGLRPANQKEAFTVTYSIDNSLIDQYNADITQLYSGQAVALPAECYKLNSNNVVIEVGNVESMINITFYPNVIAQKCTDPSKKYVIPFKLASTSKYSLHSDVTYTTALYAVKLDTPRFYFFANKDGVAPVGRKVVYGAANNTDKYEIAAFGVPLGEYKINVAYDEAAMKDIYPKETILPQDAFKITSDNIVYKSEVSKGEVTLEYYADKMDFRNTYYLPLTLSPESAFVADEEYKTLFVKIELKNEYDKSYGSKMTVASASNSRTGAYSVDKDMVSYEKDMVEMQIATNATIAGAGATGTSTTYNNKYVRVKIVPTDDKSHYDIEYVLITDKGKANNTPASFEADPDAKSYYDWNLEKFVLNYRWKHTDGKWITVEEILSAK